jgi:cation diffusion facilitator family transporter
MACDCQVESKQGIQAAVLIQLLIINGAMFCVEAVAGILANSSALLADSLDMLADAAIYGIALYAVGKSNSAKRRAAFTSGIFQGVLGLFVAGDIIRRFLFGSEPVSLAMIAIGAAALAANLACLWRLQKQRHGEVHIRASWIFTRTDALANVGTILAGALVLVTKNRVPDLIIGAIICLVVLAGCFEIIRAAVSDRLTELPDLH